MVVCSAGAGATPAPIPYSRRHPERSTLHRVVRESLPALVEAARDEDSGDSRLPAFVLAELEGHLGCGLLSRGFLRAICESCKQNVFVAFSCKGRGFCPSCCTRRMEDTTEHVVEAVLPDVPIRQWVLSLPFQLRPMVAFQPALFAAVIRIFISEVFRYTRAAAHATHPSVERALCGGIAFLQRFGSTVNMNPHVHALVLDGVYVHKNRDDKNAEPELDFYSVAPPTAMQIEDVSRRVCRRVIRLLERRGIADADGLLPIEAAEREHAVQEAAARVFPVFAYVRDGVVYPIHQRGAYGRSADVRGFSTHAGVFAPAGDRESRRRIVRYCVRPPFAEKQWSTTTDGRVAFELRRPRANGATHVVMSELSCLKKLAAIVPPPGQHQARYFGVLSSASRLRRFVVPAPRARIAVPPIITEPETEVAAPQVFSDRRRAAWAALLRRVYDVDALRCPACPNGQLRIIAAITSERAVQRILAHLALNDDPPPPRSTSDPQWTEPP